VTLAVTLLSLVAASYIAEAYLRELPFLRLRLAARRFGIPFDARDQFQVVRDLRKQGPDVYPVTFPAWQGLPSADAPLLPLGGISDVTTVFCNEMGQYVVYRSDEHGFHNPKGIWSSARFDLAVLGDSFTQGACVPTEQNFVELLRRQYPATLNLGMVGNGPLLMLAGLKEFLTDLRPGVVLWVYTEGNDLTFDLNREKRFTRLTDYLLPDHRQGLLARQSECDTFLRRLTDREYISRETDTMGMSAPGRFWRLWSLRQDTAANTTGPAGRSSRSWRTCRSPLSICIHRSPGTRTSRSSTPTAVLISARPATAWWPRRFSRRSRRPRVDERADAGDCDCGRRSGGDLVDEP